MLFDFPSGAFPPFVINGPFIQKDCKPPLKLFLEASSTTALVAATATATPSVATTSAKCTTGSSAAALAYALAYSLAVKS